MVGIVKVTFTVEDADKDKGQVLYYTVLDPYFTILGGQYFDTLEFYYQELARRLDVIIMGAITAITISFDCALPVDIKAFPIITADVQELAEFTYPRVGGSTFFQHNIPTFDHTIFGQQKIVNWQYTPELAYYTALVFNSSGAPDWDDDYGVNTDRRGVVISSAPSVRKKFSK